MLTNRQRLKSWRGALYAAAFFAGLLLADCDCRADQSKSINELLIFRAQSDHATTLLIHGTADVSAMGPVIRGFQSEFRDIEVHYRLYETVPLYQDAINPSDEKSVADLLVSSAMDLQVKLAMTDTCNRPLSRHRGCRTGLSGATKYSPLPSSRP